MTTDAPTTLVWLAPSPPDAGQQRVLAVWASSHGAALSLPSAESAPALEVDPRWAGEIDDALDRARDAIEARDRAGVDGALAHAHALLAAHPELPQAAWQMAELERTRAVRWRRFEPSDEQAAARALVRAQALDGGRVPGAGEVAATSGPEVADIDVAVWANDEPRLDGRPASISGNVRARWTSWAGPHTLVVTRDDRPIWAAWIDVPPGHSSWHPPAPPPPPCSAADLAAVAMGSTGPQGIADVRCPRWLAALPAGPGDRIRVATCRANACAAWIEAEPGAPQAVLAHLPRASARRWPLWATWTLAGAGVLVTGGVAIAIAALARKTPPAEIQFVSGGLAGP